MKIIQIAKNANCIPIVIEEEAGQGLWKIAQKSADDLELVTGIRPDVYKNMTKDCETVILYATVGKSRLLDELKKQNKISFDEVQGKREVFAIHLVENAFEGVKQTLVIYGSDKRGTIYGIFYLSKQIGVSPLLFWGDVKPAHQDEIIFDETIEMVSQEPSVRYRGFFINDEWPCFGNWTMEHFGGFTARMYDHVFELLLRLNGNYLWPAMWTSSFTLDGPEEESAKLADEYGVIMGNSHHEPCLRASEEWDIYKGEKTPYGIEWDYTANKEGLLRYWEDGLKRSSKYENIVTVGMRGERDSAMQGTSTIEDNINVLKDIITKQNILISRYADTDEKKKPRLLAIYKEVERYFYGTKEVAGLREWEGLHNIILMLCEDNYGNMRTLPDEQMRYHKGGYGMYYHLDYHGSPVSYEWINTTPLSKIWEQMTQAYEYGVHEVWMVNVGDLKGNEFPLSYFMDLAYDYKTWGILKENSTEKYTQQWMSLQFGKKADDRQVQELSQILTESVRISSLRKPESLNSHTYHPAYYMEADKMIEAVQCLCQKAESMRKELSEHEQIAYDSMIYYPLQWGMNLLLMQLYAGKNAHFAKQGKIVANYYYDLVTGAIHKDRVLAEKFGKAFNQKWKGMELEHHIGFTKWNEDGCQYPLRMMVEPFDQPRLLVSRSDDSLIAVKNYGNPDNMIIRDFLYAGWDKVKMEVANGGTGSFICRVEQEDCDWIEVDWVEKEIQGQEVLTITCKKDYLPDNEQVHKLYLTDGDTRIAIHIYGKKTVTTNLPAMTFLEQNGVIAINGEHFAKMQAAEGGEWKVLKGYGKIGCGLKAFPVTKEFADGKGPAVCYRLAVEEAGDYKLEVWSSPSNPIKRNGRLCFGIRLNQEQMVRIPSVSKDYCAGEPENEEWSRGVVNQIHKSILQVKLEKGLNEVWIYAIDPGFVLEKLFVYKGTKKESYFGAGESFYKH